MPTHMSLALGFLLGSAGTAVIVPALLILQSKGYGARKLISHELIVATTLDNVIAGTVFSVFRAIAMRDYYEEYRIISS